MSAKFLSVSAALLLLSACAPRESLYRAVGETPPALRDFPADFVPPVSAETGQPMSGFGGGGGGVNRVPVIFVHGNTVSARFWLPARHYFQTEGGYSGDELWALGYGWDNARYFDSNDLSVPSIERIVNSVTDYLTQKTGKPVTQVDIIGHSLGVTLVRQWMKQTNSWHRVRNFIGACGANQGVWTAWPDARGQNRVVSFELNPRSPWLTQLNRGGETPGATRYMTLYDGNGWSDVLFPAPFEHSSALKGAYNLPFNLEYGTFYDHLALPREPLTMDEMLEFLRKAPAPDMLDAPPRLMQAGATLRSDAADATVHCATGTEYPSSKTPGSAEISLKADLLYTCFARSRDNRLSSPMARFKYSEPMAQRAPLQLSALPRPGAYEQPKFVTLTANDPAAYIVYTTGGTEPNSGSPLYSEPIYLPGPIQLRAVAIAPDGRKSEELQLDYNISLEVIEARHTLQRQFDPDVDVHYAGERRKGR